MAYVTEKTLTDIAMQRWEQTHDPRLREVMVALVKHLHAFVREVELTEEEWMSAIMWLTKTGQLCTDKRQEFILTSDVLGVSMLVDAINHRFDSGTTPSTVQGPFFIPNSPELPMGADMSTGARGEPCYVSGVIRDVDGKPVEGAVVDVWQADGDGLYEAQIAGQEDAYLRAVYRTGPDGRYCVRTIVPLGYAIPMDGTVGNLIHSTDISYFRPAHIHFLIDAPGYDRLVTHLFKENTEYLDSDVVFGVKPELITPFRQMPAGPTPAGDVSDAPFYTVNYDFVLNKTAAERKAA